MQMRALKKHQTKQMNCFSDANMGRIHRWAPLDEKQQGLVRWHGGLWEMRHLGLSWVTGAHWGPHTVMMKAQGNSYRSVRTGFQHFFQNGLSEKFTRESPPLEDSQVAR